MTLFERVELDEEGREALAMVREAQALLTDSPRGDAASGRAPEDSAFSASMTRWGLAAVGLWFPPAGGTRAAAFVNLHGYTGPSTPLADVSARFAQRVRSQLGLPTAGLELLATSPARPHAGPGVGIDATVGGTLGFPVLGPDGTRAALTAGHVVVKHLHDDVRDAAGDLVGRVAWRDCPALHPAGVDVVDVGVIALEPGYEPFIAAPYLPPPAVVSKRSDVRSYGRLTSSVGWIEAICASWCGQNETHGDWAEVVRVTPKISVHGDSGARVLIEASSEALGQVVAGGRDFSIVQDLEFQLGSAGVDLA